jgi:hypothetical protein
MTGKLRSVSQYQGSCVGSPVILTEPGEAKVPVHLIPGRCDFLEQARLALFASAQPSHTKFGPLPGCKVTLCLSLRYLLLPLDVVQTVQPGGLRDLPVVHSGLNAPQIDRRI